MLDFDTNNFCNKIHKSLHEKIRAGIYCTCIRQDDGSYTVYVSLYNQTRNRESEETTYRYDDVFEKIAFLGSEQKVIDMIVESTVNEYKDYILRLYFVNGGKDYAHSIRQRIRYSESRRA